MFNYVVSIQKGSNVFYAETRIEKIRHMKRANGITLFRKNKKHKFEEQRKGTMSDQRFIRKSESVNFSDLPGDDLHRSSQGLRFHYSIDLQKYFPYILKKREKISVQKS